MSDTTPTPASRVYGLLGTDRGGYVPPCGDPACDGAHCTRCGEHTTFTAEAWGDAADCPTCGHHEFHSIGD